MRIEQIHELLIEQYKDAPRLKGLLGSFAEQLDDLDREFLKLLTERSLDTARGKNLDIIGKIVVLERPYTDPDPEEVFTFNEGVGKGFTNVENTLLGGYYIGLEPIDNQSYPDELYRFMLRAKIISNTTNGSLADMHRYAAFVFNTEVVISEGIGVVDISVAKPLGRQIKAIIQATFPLAAGIRLGSVTYSLEEGAFGFEGDNRNGGFGDLDDPEVGGVFVSLIID